jgi:hypothetical protein
MSRLSTSRLVVVVLCLSAPLFADDGDLDPTFWSDGKLTVSATADLAFGGLATDAGGQLAVAYSYVAAGVPMRVSVWRSVSDSTLGTTCPVVPHSGRDTWVVDLAFDASGRLLALARDYYAPDTEDWYVLAYRFPDCELDTTFGGDGVVTFGSLTPGLSAYWRLRPLADGTILVTGYNGVYGTYGCRVQVISFNPNGSTGNVLCAPPSLFAGEIFGVDATWAEVTRTRRRRSSPPPTAGAWSSVGRRGAARPNGLLRSPCSTGAPLASSSSTRASAATES